MGDGPPSRWPCPRPPGPPGRVSLASSCCRCPACPVPSFRSGVVAAAVAPSSVTSVDSIVQGVVRVGVLPSWAVAAALRTNIPGDSAPSPVVAIISVRGVSGGPSGLTVRPSSVRRPFVCPSVVAPVLPGRGRFCWATSVDQLSFVRRGGGCETGALTIRPSFLQRRRGGVIVIPSWAKPDTRW